MQSEGHSSRVFTVASAAAIGLKVGLVREGPALLAFAVESGLTGAAAESACAQALSRARGASAEMLVPSAGALLRTAASLDAYRTGSGEAWLSDLLRFCEGGFTSGARWIVSLPGLAHAAVGACPRSTTLGSPEPAATPGSADLPTGEVLLELTFDDEIGARGGEGLLPDEGAIDLGLGNVIDLDDDQFGGVGADH